MNQALPLSSDFDLFDTLAHSQNSADPYPFYRWLRSHHPVYVNPDGIAYVSTYEHSALLGSPDVRDNLEDDEQSDTLRLFNRTIIKTVPPRHTDLRRVGGEAFRRGFLLETGRQMQRAADELADRLVRTLKRDGSADLNAEFSYPFSQEAARIFFGLPEEDFDMLAALPSRMFKALYPKTDPEGLRDADDASRFLYAYLEDAVRHRRFRPGGAFDRIVEAADGSLADDVVHLCWLMWFGSYNSPLAAMDLALLTLIEEPQTKGALLADPKAWVDEALRYRSAHVINSANLTTRRELTVGDVTLPAQAPIRFLLAAINRDEMAWPNAEVFDPSRDDGFRHVAFSRGPHTCIAKQFASIEVGAAVTALASRVPRLSLAGEPAWSTYTTQRLCTAFPVKLH
ncbi:cytochrome P450 [Streptomyces sp. NPDC100445]|uniref:cytochrome P450 n=1 Tax=Streptomyces sp. NPDC100445 TaxID=3366102 RepID=UPI00382238B0